MRNVTGVLGVVALGVLTAACGTTQEQRTATGGLTGLGAGAIIGGPLGAAVGAAAGTAGGALMPEDATSIANNLLGREHRAVASVVGMPKKEPAASAAPTGLTGSSMPPGDIKTAQTKLKDQGYYRGRIDGIVGPQTRNAIRSYQQREGLSQTATLDRDTLAKLNAETTQSGSSAPSANEPATPSPPPPAAPPPQPRQ